MGCGSSVPKVVPGGEKKGDTSVSASDAGGAPPGAAAGGAAPGKSTSLVPSASFALPNPGPSSSSADVAPSSANPGAPAAAPGAVADTVVGDVVKNVLMAAWTDEAADALTTLLRSPPEVRAHFEAFLAAEFSAEHVHFYLAVEDLFREADALALAAEDAMAEKAEEEEEADKGEEEDAAAVAAEAALAAERKENMLRKGEAIFSTYVKEGALSEINVSAAIRAGAFDASNFEATLLAAQEEVHRMLTLDAFPRFLRSAHCEAMLAALQVSSGGAGEGEGEGGAGEDAQASATGLVESSQSRATAPTAQAAAGGSLQIAGEAVAVTTDSTTEGLGGADPKPSRLDSVDSQSASPPSRIYTRDSSGGTSGRRILRTTHSRPLLARLRNVRTVLNSKTPGQWLESFKAVANLLPTPIVISDMSIVGVPMVFVNDAFCKMTGYSRGECEGRNCRFLQGPGTDAATVQKLRQSIRSGKEVSTELVNYKKDGTRFRNFLTLRPVFWPEGLEGIAGSMTQRTTTTGSSPSGSLILGASVSEYPRHPRLAYFIGCQYEITDDALVAQRLLRHEAFLRMLPTQVTV
jgi:PAS domain S-box-containing protein